MPTDTQRASYATDSTFVGHAQHIVTKLQVWIAASWLSRTGKSLTSDVTTAADESALAGAGRTLAGWTRHSFLYRWLTKEPDPDVIVIDLRETYTVGPFITVLDRLAPTVARMWQGSVVARLTTRLETAATGAWLAESRTVSLLRAALEPPELPDDEQRK
jgi:hypothetical protein